MNRAELRAAVSTNLRIPPSGDGTLTSAVLNDLVGQSVRKVARERMWPWLRTSSDLTVTTAGTAALPADFIEADTLTFDDMIVESVAFHELLAGYRRYAWADDGTNVRVEPAPSASTTMTLWYYRAEPNLADDTDSPLLPANHHDLIVSWATGLGFDIRADFDAAIRWRDRYERELTNAVKQVFRQRSGNRVALRSERRQSTARWT